MTVQFASHYEIGKLTSYEQTVKASGLGDESSVELNWLFLGTSGVHGSYGVPSDSDFFTTEDEETGDEVPSETGWLTVLIVRPRTVVVLYGRIEVTREQGAALEAWAIRCADHIAKYHGSATAQSPEGAAR